MAPVRVPAPCGEQPPLSSSLALKNLDLLDLCEIELHTWHLVKHTSKVTGFVGGARNRPAPISPAEVAKIVNQMQEGIDKPKPKVEWTVGELVRVKDGPFTDFNGAIEDVNYEKSKVKVSVTIFGRATGVDLDFAQVEKI